MSTQVNFFSEIEPKSKDEPFDFFTDIDIESPSSQETPDFLEGLDLEEKQSKTKKIISKDQVPDFFDEIDIEEESQTPIFSKQKSKPKVSVYAEEKTPEELKQMSVAEKLQYARDLATQRELGQSKGFTKGVLSGATFGLSEKIPGLSPKEGEFLGGFGEFFGSVLPISKLYNFLGKPLVKLAAKSPVAKKGVQALARMTGFGLTGAAYEGAKETVKKGEVPSAEELALYGAEWAAFDGALQLLGKGASFLPKLKNYAKLKNIPEKEALNEIVETLEREKINPEENPKEAVNVAEDIVQLPKIPSKYSFNDTIISNQPKINRIEVLNDKGDVLGHLDYAKFKEPNQLAIQNLQVEPSAEGKGLSLLLLDKLHGSNPDAIISGGPFTEKGAKFLTRLLGKKYDPTAQIPGREYESVLFDDKDFTKAKDLINKVKERTGLKPKEIRVEPAKMEVEKIEPSSQKVKEAAKEINEIPFEDRTPDQTQIKALSEEAQPGDAPEKLFENTPLPDKPSVKERLKKSFLKPKTELSKQLNEIKQDYYSKKWGLEWDNRNKWDKLLKEKKFTTKELSDMQFYVENPEAFGGKKSDKGTGNPFVGAEDTYEALKERLSPEARAAVKDVVVPHFKQWVETINKSAYTRKINPRDFLEGVYVPHFYSGDSIKGAKQAAEMISKRFSTSNPFANMRTLLTYNEALQKAGMKPRFDNIADLLNEYDRVMTRVLVNSEFAGQIAELEKEMGSKLIIRSNSKKYSDAKSEGWVPFDDPYLRRYVAGTNAEGEPIWATLDTPALVHPEAADAFTGIFVKDARKPQKGGEIALWKPYDALSDFLKSMHVSLSGFHYLTLAEESAKSSGLNLFKNFIKGGELLKDPVFTREFVESGGVIGHNPELLKKASSNAETIENTLRLLGGKSKFLGDAIKGTREVLQKPTKFLFEKFQPRLKVAAFYDMRGRYLNKLTKKGIVPDAKMMKQINRELASLSNDMFGGQRWELIRNPTNFKALDFNDPKVLKAWRRAGGYVDWTASAMREFAKTGKGLLELLPGEGRFTGATPTGTAARENFFRYAKNLFISTQMLNYFFTGLTRDRDGKINWDYRKAHSTFGNGDPSKNGLDIQLPDLEFNIAGHKFNIGRDSKDRHLYTHFGKKLLENFHYFKDPIRQLFNKSNPVWQALFVQAAGGTPTLEGIPFKVESKRIRGELKPFEGKKGWATLKPRLKHLFKSALPYSIQHFDENILEGIARYLATGIGALPTKKGMSLTASEEFYDKYFHNESNYRAEIAALDKLLRDNGYSESSIKSTKTRIRNRIKEEKER